MAAIVRVDRRIEFRFGEHTSLVRFPALPSRRIGTNDRHSAKAHNERKVFLFD